MSQFTPNPTKAERKEAAKQARLAREQQETAAAARRKRFITLGAVLGVAVAIVVVAIAISSGGKTDSGAGGGGGVQGTTEVNQMLAGIPQSGIAVGRPTAPVTLVEFADPQCPFCRDYSLNEMPKVVRDYVRTGKVRMELRLMTFIGPDSQRGATAIAAAGLQGKQWNAADMIYFNQGKENSGYMTDAYLRKVLGAIPGIDINKLMSDRTNPKVAAELATARTASSRYAVDSTPTILLGKTGGDLQKVANQAVTADEIGKQIDALLKSQGT